MWWKRFYFDRQDRELLQLVNKVVNQRGTISAEHKIFDASLHPHGIKALAMSREMRVAHAVVKLLDSLEEGQSEDRLRALRTLYDEVLNSAQTRLRRNTARVLIQVMKDLVRAHGDEERQICLAHDFRRAAQGRPRVVRALLERYHLVEMPEDWSQLSFDHHVHDANTKGRKNPTHLIMDAWIKGIRHLTVIYYNYVEADAAREIMYAAEIMGISVRIGLEFSAPFRGRFVHFIWVPRGFSDTENFLEFLAEPPMRHIAQLGREASEWQQRYVFKVLERWNSHHRLEVERKLCLDIAPVEESDFRAFVGAGQPSLLHLAEFVHQSFFPQACRRMQELYAQWQALPSGPAGNDARHELELHIAALESMTPTAVHDAWLVPEKNPDLPSPWVPSTAPETPELLRLPPMSLLDWLTSLHSGYRITLNLANLAAEDVLELLWQCQGLITHLEIFNLKEWYEGKLSNLAEINALQRAINGGSAPRLKRLIRDMLRKYDGLCGEPQHVERCAVLRAILRNIPTLHSFYKAVPLRARMGTDSTSRSQKIVGMGLVFPETLTARGQAYFKRSRAVDVEIPFTIDVHRHVRYCRNPQVPQQDWLTRLLRLLPGCSNYGYIRAQEWASHSAAARFGDQGNIAPLGGTLAPGPQSIEPAAEKNSGKRPEVCYMNTRFANVLKVLAGFIPAVCAFQYTQSWWLLAWFGPVIWFGITGVRNIIQAVMAGGGFHRSTLLRWNNHVSWSRLCDSLMYTGFSVPVLELGIRRLLLQDGMGYTVANHPFMVYACMSVANGLYIAWHNIYRGLPREAIIGNLFRSALAIPVAVLFNEIIFDALLLAGVKDPYTFVQPGAAIISKTASDTVAGVIEGFADRRNNLRMRHWDYQTKMRQLLDTYARLELLFPEEDALTLLAKPRILLEKLDQGHEAVKIAVIINALDFMHFWMYQPRAQDVFNALVRDMSEEERMILARSQLVLVQEREVSQLFVNGMVGKDFGRALAFYLDKNEEYLRAMMKLCVPGYKAP